MRFLFTLNNIDNLQKEISDLLIVSLYRQNKPIKPSENFPLKICYLICKYF